MCQGAGSQEPNDLRGRYSVSAPPRAPYSGQSCNCPQGLGTHFNSPSGLCWRGWGPWEPLRPPRPRPAVGTPPHRPRERVLSLPALRPSRRSRAPRPVGAEDLGHCLAKRKTPASRPESFSRERFPAGTAGAGGDKRVPAHAHSLSTSVHANPPRCARARASNPRHPLTPRAQHPAAGPGWVGSAWKVGRARGWKRTRAGPGRGGGPGRARGRSSRAGRAGSGLDLRLRSAPCPPLGSVLAAAAPAVKRTLSPLPTLPR